MNSFSFTTVPHIHLEWHSAKKCGELIRSRFPQNNIFLVTDNFLRSSGMLNDLEISLANNGFQVSVYDQVIADPPEDVVLQCVEQAREAKAELVLAVGGGSSMDVAKLAAILCNNSQSLQDIYGVGNVQGERLPLIQMPTTAGTGSEVTNISVVSTLTPNGDTTKMGIVSHQLYADWVILDASLTCGLPPGPTAATGIDAMVHAIEAYTSRIKKNLLSDNLAKEALKLLSQNLLVACKDGNNRTAREAMLLGACLAGQSFSNAPVGAVHALAYPLGARYHIPHGLSNALMLEPVLRFNVEAATKEYAELGEVLLGSLAGTEREKAEAFINEMIRLMDESGIARRLRDANVDEAGLAAMASDAMLQTRLLTNNPINVDEASALKLYQEAY